MAYNGYRLKIDGVKVPDTYIAKGTYSFNKEDRIIDSYEDGDMIKHNICAQKKRVVIAFNFREHRMSEHMNFSTLVRDTQNISIEYYDEYEDKYATGNFEINSVKFQNKNVLGNSMNYAPAQVKITEY